MLSLDQILLFVISILILTYLAIYITGSIIAYM